MHRLNLDVFLLLYRLSNQFLHLLCHTMMEIKGQINAIVFNCGQKIAFPMITFYLKTLEEKKFSKQEVENQLQRNDL